MSSLIVNVSGWTGPYQEKLGTYLPGELAESLCVAQRSSPPVQSQGVESSLL